MLLLQVTLSDIAVLITAIVGAGGMGAFFTLRLERKKRTLEIDQLRQQFERNQSDEARDDLQYSMESLQKANVRIIELYNDNMHKTAESALLYKALVQVRVDCRICTQETIDGLPDWIREKLLSGFEPPN